MRSRFLLAAGPLLTLLSLLLLMALTPSSARAGAGDVIVIYKSSTTQADRVAARAEAEAELVEVLPKVRDKVMVLVESEDNTSATTLAAELRADPRVLSAEPDRRVQLQSTNDPRYNNLWGIAKVRAPQAWAGRSFSPVSVGVADTGVQINHPDLVGRIWTNPGEVAGDGIDNDGNGYIDDINGWDWPGSDNNPSDLHGHGTHVSGTIGAVQNNSIGVAGVAPNAQIASIKVLSDGGSGWLSDIAAGFSYAGAKGMRVVNASLGGQGSSTSVRNAMLAYPNTLYVVAAGNNASDNDSVSYTPCNEEANNVICVASTTSSDALSGFSNYGLTKVDMAAPGSSIDSTCITSSYCYMSGTSMATPHVAGAAVLLFGYEPSLTALQVKSLLMDSGDPLAVLSGKTVSGKRLNVENAVRLIDAPSATSNPTLDDTTVAEGDTLSVTAGDFSPAAASLAYQWLRDGNAIEGATESSYQVAAADRGKTLSVQVIGSSAYGRSTTTTSNSAYVAPAATAEPTFFIANQVATLTDEGSWDGLNGSTTTTYQWLRNGSPISGAVSDSYALGLVDYDKNISVRVMKTFGGSTGSSTSTSQKVTEAHIPPTNLSSPYIQESSAVSGDVISLDPGSWSPLPSSFAVVWLRNGVPIPGATSAIYTVDVADRGTALSVRVTASNSTGMATSAGSAGLWIAPVVITPPAIAPPQTPGQLTLALEGDWSGADEAATAYQWLRNGNEVAGANSESIVLVREDIGARFALRVTKTVGLVSTSAQSEEILVTEQDVPPPPVVPTPDPTPPPATTPPATTPVTTPEDGADPPTQTTAPLKIAQLRVIDNQRAVIRKQRAVRVRLTANTTGRVQVQLYVGKTQIGRASAQVSPKAGVVRVPLNRQGRVLAARSGRLQITVRVVDTESGKTMRSQRLRAR